MKAKALRRFQDNKAGKVQREAGDVFELSRERFDEINRALPGWLAEIPEPKPEPKKAQEA